MTLPDQLTLVRALAVPVVVVLFAWDFSGHLYWATAVFAVAIATAQVDGWLARRWHKTSAFGWPLDLIADKVLVLVDARDADRQGGRARVDDRRDRRS